MISEHEVNICIKIAGKDEEEIDVEELWDKCLTTLKSL